MSSCLQKLYPTEILVDTVAPISGKVVLHLHIQIAVKIGKLVYDKVDYGQW